MDCHTPACNDLWQAPVYPNKTTDHSVEQPYDCGTKGCLFDIIADPSEYYDLARTQAGKLDELMTLFIQLNQTRFEAPRIPTDAQACEQFVAEHGGFLGPYMHDQP